MNRQKLAIECALPPPRILAHTLLDTPRPEVVQLQLKGKNSFNGSRGSVGPNDMLIWFRFAFLLAVANFAHASVVSSILDGLEQAVTCASCHALLGILKPVALLGDSIFSNALIAICQTLNVRSILTTLN